MVVRGGGRKKVEEEDDWRRKKEAAAATSSWFISKVKARFDYGGTIFILTYSQLMAVSGRYRVDELAALVQQRISTIAIGILTCLARELHLLTTRNMRRRPGGLRRGLLRRGPRRAAAGQVRRVPVRAQPKAYEDEQANLVRWEPAHGRFGFRHPYGQYGKIGAAMQACACCVEALGSCASAEAQAPEHVKRLLRDACTRAGARCAQVLREASRSVATMTASSPAVDLAIADMNTAVHELQGDMRSLPSMLAETSLVMDTMPVFIVGSLLVEIAAKVEGIVDAVNELATLAC
uniref:Uncharacterized protein n=1 Tax=Setaria viridis TaxID=4556 RepID=A0A4U6TA95_SETVI|nr:hypothetical protein SEVIR_8G004000v2 [Setaria viridis]